jgi:hypothetical protein
MRTVIILLEVHGKEVRLWVNEQLLKTFNSRSVGVAGKPLELAVLLESAFYAAGVAAEIEFGEGFEEVKSIMDSPADDGMEGAGREYWKIDR